MNPPPLQHNSIVSLSYYSCKKIVDQVLTKHQLSYHINSTSQFIFKRCPFCDSKEKLYLDPKSGKWICFKCEYKGDLVRLISLLESTSREKIFNLLVSNTYRVESSKLNFIFPKKLNQQLDIEEFEKKYNEEFDEEIFFPIDIKRFEWDLNHIRSYKRFYLYLYKRGIDKKMVESFDIRFSPYMERIIFPVYFRGKLLGYQGRTILEDAKPKALTLPKTFKKSLYLYNYDRIQNEDYVTIVEGPIDACKTYKHNPLALLGKTMSGEQLELLKQLRLKRVYIALDPEESKSMKKLYVMISPFFPCYIIEIEEGKDCGDKTPEEMESYFLNSKKMNYLSILDGKIKK